MTFDQWWVGRFGRPPLPEEISTLEACKSAFDAGVRSGPEVKAEEKRAQLQEAVEECVLFDGYEDALVGICHRFGRDPIAIYDLDICLETLMDEGTDYEMASDHFWTNTMGTWAGDGTPAFLKRFR